MSSPRSLRRTLAAGLLLAALLGAPLRALTIYPVAIDTSALAGTSGLLAFDLIGGDDLSANNTATVTGLTTDGVLGDTSNFALTDTNFFNEELRSIVFGTSLSFTLQLTDHRVGAGADQFSFFLLDPLSLLPLFGTTDSSSADALFAIDLNGTGTPALSAFASAGGGATWQVSAVPMVGVPEAGSTVILLGLALGLVACTRPGRWHPHHLRIRR
jgi:hypothetical protein